MSRGMMQTPPQQGRSILRLAFFAPETLCGMFDRFPGFSFPELFSGFREGVVRDWRIFRVGSRRESSGNEILCEHKRNREGSVESLEVQHTESWTYLRCTSASPSSPS